MKVNRFGLLPLSLLASAVSLLAARQSEADRQLMAELRAQAEKGDARSQYELGRAFGKGSLGVPKAGVKAV